MKDEFAPRSGWTGRFLAWLDGDLDLLIDAADAADEDVRLYIVPRRRPFRSELLSRRPRGFFAELAADAAFLKKERPARRRDALRIMAPAAIQRTTFEEYGRSDTGTIVRRKASNVKNRADTPQIAFVLLDRPCLRTTPPAASRPVPPQ